MIVVKKTYSNGWAVEEFIYPNGEHENKYYFLDARAPLVRMNKDKLTRQYAGYTLIEKDLRSTLVWLKEIQASDIEPLERYKNPRKMDLIKAYFVAAITFYGKCFTLSEGRRLKFDRTDVPEEHRKLHDLAMKTRHNLTAHSGEGFENARVSLVLHPTMESNMKPELYTELLQPDYFEPIGSMISLVEAMQKIALQKRDKVGDKIMEDVVWPKGKLFWYTHARYD